MVGHRTTVHLNNIFVSLRTVFPISTAVLTAFSRLWTGDPKITPKVRMHAGQETWIGITGEAPENNTTALELLKGKMMDGVPSSVKQQMFADWTQTETDDDFTSPSHPVFTFYKVQTSTLVVLAHQQFKRHHGAEDNNDPEAEAALDQLPSSL